jgi:hypothetical protein
MQLEFRVAHGKVQKKLDAKYKKFADQPIGYTRSCWPGSMCPDKCNLYPLRSVEITDIYKLRRHQTPNYTIPFTVLDTE